MGVYSGPDVSESGLVLYLDAGNNKSHSTNRFISYGTGLTTQGISFQVNGDGTFQRIAAGTVIGGYTVRTTDVVYSYALGSNGCHYHGNDVSVPGGSYATFSFDYLVTGATNYPSTDYLANFENLGNTFSNSIGTANNTQNVWQRRSFTSGPSSVNGTLRMLLYPGGCGGRLADSGTLYFRNPKVEFTNVDTGNGNFSSMPNVTTWYDMTGNSNNGTLTNTPYYIMGSNNINNYISFDGSDDYVINSSSINIPVGSSSRTIQLWVYPKADTNVFVQLGTGGGGNQLYIVQFYNNGGTRYLFTDGINSANNLAISGSQLPTLNAWNHITFGNSGQNWFYYLNGVSQASGTWSVALNTVGQKYIVGKRDDVVSNTTNGNIAQVQIYNRALTASEIQQNFNATRSRFGV